MHLPQLLVHPIIPHTDQALLAPADNFPVIHLDCGDSKLVGRERQGDLVGAEVMDSHPGRPKMSMEVRVKGNDKSLLGCAGWFMNNSPMKTKTTKPLWLQLSKRRYKILSP